MEENTDKFDMLEHLRRIGRIKSPKKAESARRNLRKAVQAHTPEMMRQRHAKSTATKMARKAAIVTSAQK